jgi:hypothetical protein
VSDLESWLTERLAESPRRLRDRILGAVRGALGAGPTATPAPNAQLPATLQYAAESLLEEAKAGPPTRDTAMTLLAADALITFAMEAEASQVQAPTAHRPASSQ